MVLSIEDAQQDVDVRSDVYSLGVILYELLCGKQPFTAPTLELLQERITHTPAQAPHQVNTAIARDLSRIMLQALAKKPADRYRSAGQLARELRRWGAGAAEGDALADAAHHPSAPAARVERSNQGNHRYEPAAAARFGPSSVPTPLARPASGHKSKVWVAASVLGLAGLGLGVWLWLDSPSSATAPGTAAMGTMGSQANRAVGATSSVLVAPVVSKVPAMPASAQAPARSVDAFTALGNDATATPVSAPASAAASASSPPTTATTGRIHIIATPWGEVEVDGKKVGVSPPLTFLSLQPGEHTVVLRNADYAARAFKVKVELDKTERVAHKFQ